ETAQLAGGLSVYRASASTPAREQPVKKRTIFGLILIVTALLGLVLLARTSGTRLVGLLLGEQFPYDMPAGHWVALLHSEERGNRERALDAVLILGPVAREAAPALAGMLNDEDPGVRWKAATALWRVDFQAEPMLLEAAPKLRERDDKTLLEF